MIFGRGRPSANPLGYEWNTETGDYGGKVAFAGRAAPHLLLLGPNGSGKGTRLLIPALLELANRSLVVIDPKAELAAVTAAWRRTVSEVVILNPFGLLTREYPVLQSAGFNP
ncbi:MAG: type IV secretory system conjugative DNA transfer family protein [Methylocella sp.]